MTLIPLSPSAALHLPPRGDLGGLVALVEGVEAAFPLVELKVRTTIVADCARTVVEQRFANPHAVPLEAVHVFPLPEDGAVTEVTLHAGEVTVRAELRERQAAEQAFAEARDAGHRAALLTVERADVHTLRVTRIPPGEEVRVRIVIAERLEKVDGRYRWRFPTVIAPRYLPGQATHHDGPGVLPATDRVPDADRLQPPIRLVGGTRLDLEVEIEGPVRNLQCAQHAFRVDLDSRIRVAPAADSTLDRDFVLAFGTADADAVTSRAWTDGQYTLVSVEPPSQAFPDVLPRDAVFVVDISGSMSGVKMEAAKRALRTALHGLTDGDRFRLVAFDDSLHPMSPDLLAYDARTLARADAWIDALGPRGGTEMLPAIQEALKHPDVEGRGRSVLFVTDGQAWNEAELTAAVAHRRGTARFFTLGIDSAVNGALLKRLARVGGGTCELATPSDDIEAVVAALEARFGNPVLDQVLVEGLPGASLQPASVFVGRPAVLLVEGAPGTVVVAGRSASGVFRVPIQPVSTGVPLGPLFAKARITALEDRLLLKPFEEEAVRPEILRLSLAHGVACTLTAFVAVDRSRVVGGPLREQIQPAQQPSGWANTGVPAGAAPPPPPQAAPAPKRAMEKLRSFFGSNAPVAPPAPAPAMPGEVSFEDDEGSAVRSLDLGLMRGGAAPSRRRLQEAKEEVGISDIDQERSPGRVAITHRELPAKSDVATQVRDDAWLAGSQQADGSFGGDVARTAAALLLLVLRGHTRRTGARRRTVAKAAAWLATQDHPLARLALEALEAAERGEQPVPTPDWAAVYASGPEGRALEQHPA